MQGGMIPTTPLGSSGHKIEVSPVWSEKEGTIVCDEALNPAWPNAAEAGESGTRPGTRKAQGWDGGHHSHTDKRRKASQVKREEGTPNDSHTT